MLGVTLSENGSITPGPWKRDLDLDLQAIQDWGARALVSLIEGHEFDLLGVTELPANQDYGAAVKWYLLAANKGNVDAQFNMGYMFEYGFGVAKNCDKAEEWYNKAASQGDEEAQEILDNFKCRDFTYVASQNHYR